MSFVVNPFLFPPPAATISYSDSVANGADQASYTFSGRAIGIAAANRTVFVVVGGQGPNGMSISTLTVGGVSASLVVTNNTTYGGAQTGVEIWQADVPTGTTGDIVVNYSATANDCTIGLFAAYGIAAAASATATSSANPMSASLSIPAGGVAIGGAYDVPGGSPTASWTNLTERFDSNAANLCSGASDAFATAQTPTITCTPSAYYAGRMVLASFAAG